jgi:hypothetical protein
VQGFSSTDDYNSKWAPQYTDAFARNLKGGPIISNSSIGMGNNPVIAIVTLSGVLLWNIRLKELLSFLEGMKLNKMIFRMGRFQKWI